MDLWLLEVFLVAAAISPPSLIPAFWLSPFGLLAITSIHGVLEHGVPYIGLLAFFWLQQLYHLHWYMGCPLLCGWLLGGVLDV